MCFLGYTNITIGNETTPVASAEEVEWLNQDVYSKSEFLASDWLTNNANTHGAHPSATGYAGIAKAMRTLIEKCLKEDYFADYLPN